MSADDMYCSQQICIPPLFPYALRQFAKSAIRSQPTDLLRWSAAYFRCLALNVPPPVKTRLEYPIPPNFEGVTPGWLKTLIYQFGCSKFVTFKVLWEKWLGTCLNHPTLIKLLVLGGFTNPMKIPFYRFIGLCTGLLTKNLTETMLLFCEIATEEPEGGSAMITVELFNEVYLFLARIDASKPQYLPNKYFKDNLLGFYQEPPKEIPIPHEIEEEFFPEEEFFEEEEAVEEESTAHDDSVYSCPDIAVDKGIIVEEKSEVVIMEALRISDTTDLDDNDFFDVLGTSADDEVPVNVYLDVDNKSLSSEEHESWISETTQGGFIGKTAEKPLKGTKGSAVAVQAKEGPVAEEEFLEEEEGEHTPFTQQPSQKFDDDIVAKRKFRDVEVTDLLTEPKEEMIYIEAIPGIGAPVPRRIVEDVIHYTLLMSKEQHGMFMPKNIRHFSCPPLEPLYDDNGEIILGDSDDEDDFDY